MEQLIAKVSSKGQVVVPAKIRKDLGIVGGVELLFTPQENGEIKIEKMPSRNDWEELLKDMPGKEIDLSSPKEVAEMLEGWNY